MHRVAPLPTTPLPTSGVRAVVPPPLLSIGLPLSLPRNPLLFSLFPLFLACCAGGLAPPHSPLPFPTHTGPRRWSPPPRLVMIIRRHEARRVLVSLPLPRPAPLPQHAAPLPRRVPFSRRARHPPPQSQPPSPCFLQLWPPPSPPRFCWRRRRRSRQAGTRTRARTHARPRRPPGSAARGPLSHSPLVPPGAPLFLASPLHGRPPLRPCRRWGFGPPRRAPRPPPPLSPIAAVQNVHSRQPAPPALNALKFHCPPF